MPKFFGGYASNDVYSIGVSATQILENVEVADPNIDAVSKAVLDETSIVTELLLIESKLLATKAENFYNYGKDVYTHGLPSPYRVSSEYSALRPTEENTLIQDVIEAIEGEAINVIDYDMFELPDAKSEALQYMYRHYDYNSLTNSCNPLLLGHTSDTTVEYVSSIYRSNYTVDITFDITKDVITTQEVVNITLRSAYRDMPILKFNYTKTSTGLREYWWTYSPMDREHPSLGSIVLRGIAPQYYPIVPVRINTHWVNEDTRIPTNPAESPYQGVDSELNTTTRGILSTLDIGLDTITEAIGENESIDEIADAFVAFLFNITTQTPEGMLYLYEYFYQQSPGQERYKADWDTWLASDREKSYSSNRMVIRDTVNGKSHSDYVSILDFNYIDVVTKSGVIAPVGSATSTITLVDPFREGLNLYYQDTLVLCKQISVDEYIEVTVHGLCKQGKINEKSVPIGEKPDRRDNQTYTISLATAVSDNTFRLPLSRKIMTEVFINDDLSKEKLFTETLTLLIHAVDKTKVEWYQTTQFILLVKAIGFVISLYSLNPYVFALTTALTYTAVLWILLKLALHILITMITAKAILWIVEQIGGKYALMLAAVIAIVAVAVGVTGIDLGMYMPSAEVMLQAVNAITSAVTEYAYDEISQLQQETEDFLKSAEEKQEELDAAADLLYTDIDYDMLNVIVNPPTILDESPEQFFNRTIHIGNPGVLSLNAPNDFVSNLLTLPDNLIT